MPTLAQRQHAHADLVRIPEEARAARESLATAEQNVRADDRWSDAQRDRLLQQVRDGATNTTTSLRTRARDAVNVLTTGAEELDRDAAAALQPADRLAENQERQQAWARAETALDAGRHWSSLLDDAVAANDRATILALRAEVPARLAAQHAEGTRGQAGRSREQWQGAEVLRALDGAVVRVIGDDGGHGTAALARAQVAAYGPLVESEVLATERAARGDRSSLLRSAIGNSQARQNRDAIQQQANRS